jgi:ribonuclease VapC
VIIDTSALVAILAQEPGHLLLRTAIAEGPARIPAPVVVEFHRVAAVRGAEGQARAARLLSAITSHGGSILPFSAEAAAIAAAAIPRHGTGNGRGGTLNLLDLMVYGMAQALRAPILCTGRDFAATDAHIHPASRP